MNNKDNNRNTIVKQVKKMLLKKEDVNKKRKSFKDNTKVLLIIY